MTTTSTTQRSSQLKNLLSRESNLGTLQSGQEEDFSKNTAISINPNSSAISNSKAIITSSSTLNHSGSDSKDLYYNRFIKQTSSSSPPLKLSSSSPTKLKVNQMSNLNSTQNLTMSNASLPSNSFSNWQQQINNYSNQSNQLADSDQSSFEKSIEVQKNQSYNHQNIPLLSKTKRTISSSLIENTPPQSPACGTLPTKAIGNPESRKLNDVNLGAKHLDDSNDIQTINEFVSPLKSTRLRPLRQQTRNAVVSFCAKTFFRKTRKLYLILISKI